MAVVATPTGGSVRFTYLHNMPNLSINGINPHATPDQILDLVQGIASIQIATIRDVFLNSEFELEEE